MHNCDETASTLRKLEERRSKMSASKKQGYDRSLADLHTTQSSTTPRGGIQTGISAFFSKSDKKAKKPKMNATSVLENLPSSEENSPNEKLPSVTPSAGKRKVAPGEKSRGASSEKKPKTLAPIFTIGKKPASSPSNGGNSPNEKDLTTVVNDDGIIEVVSVPKQEKS